MGIQIGSGDFYENATDNTVRVTFEVKRGEDTGAFSLRFEGEQRTERVSVPRQSESFIATGSVRAGGNATITGLSRTEQVSIELVELT